MIPKIGFWNGLIGLFSFSTVSSAKSAPVSLQRCSLSLSPTVKAHAFITLGKYVQYEL